MNRFISEAEIQAQADKATSLTKTELEWERVRTGGSALDASTTANGSTGPSLYEMLKQREEESAIEEEEKARGAGIPKAIDEDEARFFEEQRQKEREESRKMEIQLENFKKAAALASAQAKAEPPLLSILKKKSDTPTPPKKLAPIAKLVPIAKSADSNDLHSSDGNSKKRPLENAEEGSPTPKVAKSGAEETPKSILSSKFAKYRRHDDDED